MVEGRLGAVDVDFLQNSALTFGCIRQGVNVRTLV